MICLTRFAWAAAGFLAGAVVGGYFGLLFADEPPGSPLRHADVDPSDCPTYVLRAQHGRPQRPHVTT